MVQTRRSNLALSVAILTASSSLDRGREKHPLVGLEYNLVRSDFCLTDVADGQFGVVGCYDDLISFVLLQVF